MIFQFRVDMFLRPNNEKITSDFIMCVCVYSKYTHLQNSSKTNDFLCQNSRLFVLLNKLSWFFKSKKNLNFKKWQLPNKCEYLCDIKPSWGPGVKSRMCPPHPQRVVKVLRPSTNTGNPFYGNSEKPPHLVAFYDTLGIRRTYYYLNPNGGCILYNVFVLLNKIKGKTRKLQTDLQGIIFCLQKIIQNFIWSIKNSIAFLTKSFKMEIKKILLLKWMLRKKLN